MIVDKVERPVFVSVETTQRRFRIDETGLVNILTILRKNMYANPVRIIVQEYANNARDAHVECGVSNRPIQITCPTEISPYLKIRDFGVGISPEMVDEIFVAYGASTKRHTNELVGGFGLGAKSAFSYCDAFEITTVHNGVKYTYAPHIDASDVGEMPLVFQEQTEEESGTLISIPIRDVDISRVNSAIVLVTEHWDLRPEIVGNVNYANRKVYFTENNWSLCEKAYNYQTSEILYCVEGIPYNFRLPIEDERFTSEMRALANCPFVVKLKTGDVTIASNREALVSDEKTLNKIRDILSEIDTDFRKHIMESISACESLEEMFGLRKMYLSLKLEGMVKAYKWKGINITGYKLPIDQSVGTVQVLELTQRGNVSGIGYGYKIKSTEDHISFVDHEYPIFVFFEENGEEVHRNQILNALLTGPNQFPRCQLVKMRMSRFDNRLADLGFGYFTYDVLNDYSKKNTWSPRNRSGVGVTRASYYIPGDDSVSSERAFWEIVSNSDVDDLEGGIYVPLRSRESGKGLEFIKKMMLACENIKVYGIPVNSMRAVEENPSLVHYEVYLKEYCERAYQLLMSDSRKDGTILYASMYLEATPGNYYPYLKKLIPQIEGDSLLAQWGDMIRTATSISAEHKMWYNNYNFFAPHFKLDQIEKTKIILDVAKLCMARYKMLDAFNQGIRESRFENPEHIIAGLRGYAEQIDSAIKNKENKA